MEANSPQAAEIKAEIDKLIDHVSRGELDILETLYHDDMKIYMLNKGGENTELQIIDKSGFIAHLNDTIKGGNFPNTWARFHVVEADQKNGHVVISRKTNLGTEGKVISLSIDFIFEDGRWQITREVIFAI